MKTATIITSNDNTYRAILDTDDNSVRISYREGSDWIWAGDGKWDGSSIADCAADLGDEAYEMLDAALANATEE